MATVDRAVTGVVAEFFAKNPTPQQILPYKFPEDIQEQLELLLERNSADTLTPAERTELQEIVRMDQFVGLVKAKTKLKLKQAEHGDQRKNETASPRPCWSLLRVLVACTG